MTTKEYLSQYRHLNARIDAKIEQVTRLRELATRVFPSQSDCGHSGGTSDRVGNIVAKIVDIENETNADIDSLIDLQRDIMRRVSTIDDDRLQAILEMRYINCRKWEYIAVEMHIDLKWIYKLHGRALQKLTIESDYKPVV